MTVPLRSPDFQRAFVALRYYFGARDPNLAEPLGAAAQPSTAELARELQQPERSQRARSLSVELARLSAALDERGLWR